MTLTVLASRFANSVIGVQLDNDGVLAAIVEDGQVVRRHQCEIAAARGPAQVVDAIVVAVHGLDEAPQGIGVAIPGEMDGAGRCWGMTHFQGFDGVHLGDELAERLGCPVFIESEGNAAAGCERLFGHGQGHASFLTVRLGERLSAGVQLQRELHRGNSGFAAQLAHLQVQSGEDARPCYCGRHGCLDAYASLRALCVEYEGLAGTRAAPHEVLELAAQGNAQAATAVKALAEWLGTGLALAQNLLDLDAIIVLCQTPALFREIEPTLRTKLRELVFGAAATEVPLFESSFRTEAVVIGAAAMAESCIPKR